MSLNTCLLLRGPSVRVFLFRNVLLNSLTHTLKWSRLCEFVLFTFRTETLRVSHAQGHNLITSDPDFQADGAEQTDR